MTDLVLSPRDGLFLKDGREWATSEAGRAHSLAWPMPSTLLGALVTARGRLKETTGQRLAKEEWQALAEATELGPTIALRRLLPGAEPWQSTHRVWPVPADALFFADAGGRLNRVRRLDPRPAQANTLGRDDEEAREALWWPRADDPTRPARPPQWWAEAAFVAWLADDKTLRACNDMFRGLALPRHTQSHVGIDPKTLTARRKFCSPMTSSRRSTARLARRNAHLIANGRSAAGCRRRWYSKKLRSAAIGGSRASSRRAPTCSRYRGPWPMLSSGRHRG